MKMPTSAELGGIHPRSEQLIELTRSYDRGKTERASVEKQIELDTIELVKLQDESGFENFTDGPSLGKTSSDPSSNPWTASQLARATLGGSTPTPSTRNRQSTERSASPYSTRRNSFVRTSYLNQRRGRYP